MPHIHTEPGQHDLTASAFIVRIIDGQPNVLLHMHKKLGLYLQFGGHVELDETPAQAVKHEVEEESGYKMNQLRLLQPRDRLKSLSARDMHPYPVVLATHPFDDGKFSEHFHTDITYAFVTEEAPENVPKEGESVDLRYLKREELVTADEPLMPRNVAETAMYIMDTCLKSWEQVPAVEIFK
jgi:8-oxo-dGTP pyrophosphatase MutT (NUDIX family)